MIGRSISLGFSRASRRKGLILLIYLLGLALAVLIVFPLVLVFGNELGDTGFAKELAEQFNFLVFFDLVEETGGIFGATLRTFLLAIPFFLIWKVAAHVGLIHALQGDATESFWEGVGRYTLKGLGIAVLYLVPLLLLLFVAGAILGAVSSDMNEIPQFYVRFVAIPVVTIGLAALLDCMHDYARIHLVLHNEGVFASWLAGSAWPFRHMGSVVVYFFWFVLGAILWTLPFLVDHFTVEKAALTAIGVLLLQQIVQLFRTGVTVGWVGSEVAYFEANAPEVPEEAPVDEAEFMQVDSEVQSDEGLA